METLPVTHQGMSTRALKNLQNLPLKIEALKFYEAYIPKYPKSQLCTFYLRGLCWYEDKCKFSHGVENLDIEMYFKFHQDRKEKKTTEYDLVQHVQKSFMIIKRDYKILFDFQEKNRELIPNYYTYDQLNQDARKRIELRRIFHRNELEKFSRIIFSVYETLSIKEFEDHFSNLGFTYKLNYLSQHRQIFLSKSISQSEIKDGKKITVKKSIIKLMPKSEDIISNFVKIILNDFNEKIKNNQDEIFPLTFKYVNNLIIKNANFSDPLIHHYLKVKNITSSEFLEELIENSDFIQGLDEISKKFNYILPEREKIIYTQNISEVINEIKDTFWNKFYNSVDKFGNSPKEFGFMNFNFIKENYFDKIIEHKHNQINESQLNNLFKKTLLQDKNLLFMNNNNNVYVFNPKMINSIENLHEEFLESEFERRCSNEDLEIQKIISEQKEIANLEEEKINNSEHEKNENNLDNKFSNLNLTSSDYLIKIIDDQESFNYFKQKSEKFKTIAVDLEGKLSCKTSCQIDLIQICDSESSEIFILDIHKILNLNKDKDKELFNQVKINLTLIFESTSILKIFHDGRKDSHALHYQLNICVSNYVDSACIYSALKQFRLQHDFHSQFYSTKEKEQDILMIIETEFANLFSYIYNSVNPGLNKVLEAYHPEKKVNHLKDKIHDLFVTPGTRENYFLKRPR
jgi:hypothetical protein